MSRRHEPSLRDLLANASSHIMCRRCWYAGATGEPSLYGFRIAGACCYCGAATDDGIPYGSPPNDRRLVCAGRHAWTSRDRTPVGGGEGE